MSEIELCEECDEICDDGRSQLSPWSGKRLCKLCLRVEEIKAGGEDE